MRYLNYIKHAVFISVGYVFVWPVSVFSKARICADNYLSSIT